MIKKIFDIFINILIVILIIIVGYLSFCKIYGKAPNVFGYSMYVVASGSMEPTLSVGEYILIKDVSNYKKNDIITYKLENVYITHRIIKLDGDKVITKGDANEVIDDPVDKTAIQGKFILKLNTASYMSFLFILVFVLVIYMVSSFWNKRRKVLNE